MAAIDERITTYVMRENGLPHDAARDLQKRYLVEHGTSLDGLMANYSVDPHAYLDEVHDVSLDSLIPDPDLRTALFRLPGRRLVFTNGSARHAERVLEHLNLADLFEDVFHLEAADLIPKPKPEAFFRLIARHAVTPASAAFFEDSVRNLAPAAELGMTTVLVGEQASADRNAFVDHRTPALRPFLERARVMEPTP
jgi:putative hydrolase of the HAD superfamily